MRPRKNDVTYTGSHPVGAAGPSEVYRIDPDGSRTAVIWRLDLASHSPTGLSWGYRGSGPAQCALAILADFLENNDELAVRLHQDFNQRFVARFGDEWKLTGRSIRKWLAGNGTKAETEAYEEKLQLRTVSGVVEDEEGYTATLDPCGHEVWFATKPPAQTYCGECTHYVPSPRIFKAGPGGPTVEVLGAATVDIPCEGCGGTHEATLALAKVTMPGPTVN